MRKCSKFYTLELPLLKGMIELNHKLPALTELIQTNLRIFNAQELLPPQLDETIPVFVQRQATWYVANSSHLTVNLTIDCTQAPWEPAAVTTLDSTLADAIHLLATHNYLLIEKQPGVPIGYLHRGAVIQAIFSSYEILEAYFETMIKTMDASISVIDEKARVMVWTEGAERIFSLKAKETIGRPITEFFPLEMLETLKSLQSGQSLYRHQHQPREDLVVLINTNPIYLHDKIIGAVAAETDITSQVRLNQELLNANKKVNHLQQEMAKLSPTPDPFAQIKGTSLPIRHIKSMIQKLSATQATVLITGESGVGKELFAKAVHDVREGSNAPFIAINCGAISPTLFESELFGYEKGAFSGADQKGKKGMIELARGGTLFLDEVGEMPLDMQVKLLRVLQEKKYYSVGGTKQIEADFRVVAATNKNLEELVKEGKFRQDLFYRLNVVTLKIPPLRERIEDTIELAHFFLYEFSLRYNRPIHAISQNVMQNLLQYDWPGNIRELRNAIERLVVFATDGIIKEEDLPYSLQGQTKQVPIELPPDLFSLQEEIEAHERRVILRAIELENGNKQAAAKRLGISRATLYNKLGK
ncbi:sigma-54 interaction domain-containing protein [Brevibacillus porteri]|uniref:Sigma-54-dependent Fis family transcriptional regulator n=1 Tax=Brevibacillus porteri TaxID=2126350 RepID=A0ABX5FS90_9BACL|nr:sigma 54-interacting transcriptional regulator [Brevibacillus porteri]MED1797949.1 sigma 54-interacting transcriptional regulator [Brevibacillus porteri]MED2132216.1 sigma 54-interacting transcriptional regulator [Brevibacillus porteri]MED2748085.1 sigma 54-interacting transcriptional regulator [Brevibacillus porteri]MED2814255.1 sigma 54-interacting transcriptional regulator [Brevibacillus porteri]MED2893816.1 sigma 54-interacting transcriptional regulator [Brevibacillus porteri]